MCASVMWTYLCFMNLRRLKIHAHPKALAIFDRKVVKSSIKRAEWMRQWSDADGGWT